MTLSHQPLFGCSGAIYRQLGDADAGLGPLVPAPLTWVASGSSFVAGGAFLVMNSIRNPTMPGLNAVLVPVTPFQQNCAVLWEEATKRGAVVDPGGEVERILAAIDQHGVRPEKILLTHGHIDHAGGAVALKEALGRRARAGAGDEVSGEIPIEGPDERDLFLLDGLEQQGRAYGFADARNVTPDRWLREGDEVAIGQHAFTVLHCPGHTPGHVVLVNAAARFAIVGDVLFRGSIGRTDFPYGDHEALIRAIETKLLPLGDDVSFICGHGPGSTIGAERRSNPFLRG